MLILLTPIGIILPHWLKSGGAWGEWSVKTVKEQTGIEPEGMKKNSEIYKAPVPDYNPGKGSAALGKQSAGYIISALTGTGIILILTFGAVKIVSRKKTR